MKRSETDVPLEARKHWDLRFGHERVETRHVSVFPAPPIHKAKVTFATRARRNHESCARDARDRFGGVSNVDLGCQLDSGPLVHLFCMRRHTLMKTEAARG